MHDDLDWSLLSDEEVEQRMDEIVESLRLEIEADENKTVLLNAARMTQLEFTYLVMRRLTQGRDVSVTYKLYEPFRTMGSVSVEGKSIEFDSPEWFARAAEFASNTDVYPLADNKVRLTFTFHGLTAPIE
ncbi:MAG: hypothetical protein NC548_48705 [Lachnospiraceae bacterium]|nr:hypothetical protein [Lachnospiraceae bacterium]MCM1232432.1 hypothetical protein [Ruminococcus flavefaciens]